MAGSPRLLALAYQRVMVGRLCASQSLSPTPVAQCYHTVKASGIFPVLTKGLADG